MTKVDFRRQTSLSHELNRFFRNIDKLKDRSFMNYESLRQNADYLQKNMRSGTDETSRLKHIKAIIRDLQEDFWELNELLLSLNSIEVFDSSGVADRGANLAKELIDLLKEMEPRLHNLGKVWKMDAESAEALKVENDLCELCENEGFSELYDVLDKILNEIKDMLPQVRELSQKRII